MAGFDVPQTLTVSQLRKSHGAELLGTGQTAHPAVAATTCHGLVAAVILVYVAGALFPLALLAGIIPFGWRLATASPWIELSVESARIGGWNAVTLLPSTKGVMRHALGYEEPEALKQIAKFMG